MYLNCPVTIFNNFNKSPQCLLLAFTQAKSSLAMELRGMQDSWCSIYCHGYLVYPREGQEGNLVEILGKNNSHSANYQHESYPFQFGAVWVKLDGQLCVTGY